MLDSAVGDLNPGEEEEKPRLICPVSPTNGCVKKFTIKQEKC